jgi:hypothetical protein
MGVLLISEVKLKNFTSINKNVDMDVLKANVQICQDIDLQTIIGTKFYNHLCSQVTATGNTFNPDEKILVDDYIQPYLLQQSYFRAMPNIMYRTMNNGITQGQMENASIVDVETFKYLRNVQKQTADFYMTRLQDYLLIGRGQNKFPDYVTQSTIDGMIPDRAQKYMNGIALRHSSRKGYDMRQISKQFTVYSELQNENPPCQDCY